MYKQNKILALIIARKNSTRLKNKNLQKIKGRKCVEWTFIASKKSKYIDKVFLSTDSKEIINIAKKYNIDVPFIRPAYLATDEATSVDALIHAVNFCETQDECKYDYIIELMATNPLKNKDDVEKCLIKLKNTNADSVIGVTKVEEHHPARIKKIESDKILDFCVPELSSRRQDLRPFAYIRNGSIYALNRNKLIIERHRFGGLNSRPHIMPYERSINIDSIMDLKLCELFLS